MGEYAPGVATAQDGAVLTVTLANERRANALTMGMLDDISRTLGSLGADVGVVLLTGAGDKSFCSGADLGEVPTPEKLSGIEARVGSAVDAIRECPVPVIAVVSGAAVGGGLELAMACDWRIASHAASFAMPPGRLGIVYSPRGLQLFVAAIGPAQAAELFLTGGPINATRALELRLVNAVYPAAELGDRAREAAEAVAAIAPISARGTVAIIRALGEGSLSDDGREIAQAWRDRAYASADLKEGLAAFRERRAPHFSGQ
jgi:enoyl-CoA hydratase/carnithine racemase